MPGLPNLHFATCLCVRPARSLQRVARAQKKFTFHHMFGRSKRTISADGCCGQRSFISPHHMFAHPTCTISAEGCPRTNKTRISPHVWVSDTPQRVTYRKPSPGCRCPQNPYPLKNGIWGGGVVLKFHFKIQFLQSCFLNDHYSSSFHVIGKQVKIKYLRLAPEGLSTCQTEAAHV